MKIAACALLIAATSAAQQSVRVTTLAGETIEAGLAGVVDERAIVVTLADGAERQLALDDLETIDLSEASPWTPRQVPGRLWLRSGASMPVAFVEGAGTAAHLDIGLVDPGAPAAFDLRTIAALRIGPADVAGGEAFERAVAEPLPTDDLLFAWNRRSGELTRLSARILGFDGRNLRVDFGGERTLPADQVHGIVMGKERGARPDPLPKPLATIELGGVPLTGRLVAWRGGLLDLRLAEGPVLRVPTERLAHIAIASSRVAYLSSMTPIAVVQTPAFDRARPWQRDAAPGGAGLRLGGRTYSRGLCLIPKTALTFALTPGEFDRLEAWVGIDERSTNRLADVAVRVLLDGKPAVEWNGIGRDTSPRLLRVPLGTAEQLTLEVDFGANLDLGDHLDVADAKLLRS